MGCGLLNPEQFFEEGNMFQFAGFSWNKENDRVRVCLLIGWVAIDTSASSPDLADCAARLIGCCKDIFSAR